MTTLSSGSATAVWPNEPVKIPKKSDLGNFNGVAIPSGFIPAGKKAGQIEIYNLETDPVSGPWNIASLDSIDYSYHYAIWKDIDGDGLNDCLCARFHTDVMATYGELVWFKNPGGLSADGTGFTAWEQNVLITGGPDVFISIEDMMGLDGKTYEVLVTSELWTGRVMLYYVEKATGAWANPVNIRSTIVDPAVGTPFEAKFYDLNLDGKLEIVSSSTDSSIRTGGSLWLYEQTGCSLTGLKMKSSQDWSPMATSQMATE